ncbi:MAG: hypothetical protein MZW92_00975 [Comamonadaceae bacterium]|nr:hypothetical protein [Comamonadaceae bacterium]
MEMVSRSALAISHDRDIANENTQTEPSVEFIWGKVVAGINGNYGTRKKNVRLLHLTVEISGAETTIELPATEKFTIAKNQLC